MAVPVTEEPQLSTRGKLSRRTFLKRASLAAGTAALGLAGYAGLIEPNEIDIKKIEMKIARLAPAFDGFKIAVLSDLHFGPYTGAHEISAAVTAANRLSPDLVAVLGDFVSEKLSGSSNEGARKAEPCAQILAGLRSRFGTLAVLGNHDYATDPEFVADALTSHKVPLLRNASRPIEKDGQRLWFLGVNDITFSAQNLDDALTGVPDHEPKVLLAHEPDFADYSSQYGIDVQLSGHSHGGQVRIPGLPPLLLPEFARKYYEGYYRVRGLQLYTNRGIGTVGLPFRFLCPPEVTLVTLRSA